MLSLNSATRSKGAILKNHMSAILGREYEPDPFEMQIASFIIERRSAFLLHSTSTATQLDEAARDYAACARQLIETSGAVSPFSADPDETATPPEIFLETDTRVGLTQRILKPPVGMEVRLLCLNERADARPPQMTCVHWTPGALAVMELIQHPDRRWQVLHVEANPFVKRRGIATIMYDRIEQVLDCKLQPSGWLSDDAYRFWRNRGHWSIEGYRQMDHFEGMWLSPKALLTLWAINRAKLDAIKEQPK